MWAAGISADLFFLEKHFTFSIRMGAFCLTSSFPNIPALYREYDFALQDKWAFFWECAVHALQFPPTAQKPFCRTGQEVRVCKWLVCVPWWTSEHRNFNSPFCNPSALSRGNLRRPTGNSSWPIFCPTRLSQNSDIGSTHCVFDSSVLYRNFTKVDL